MITAINNIYKPHFKQRKTIQNSLLHSKDCDLFCKSTNKKEETIQMSSKYEQQSSDFNRISNLDILQKRTCTMPIMMDGVILGISSYIKGGINRQEFIEAHSDKCVPLYKRIEFGDAAEEYKENYKAEIDLVKSVSAACYTYTQNKLNDEQFDSIIENAVENYTNTEIKRNKNFVI